MPKHAIPDDDRIMQILERIVELLEHQQATKIVYPAPITAPNTMPGWPGPYITC